MASLLTEAGLPDGVVNLIHGIGTDIGGETAAHPGIDKISFTGSTDVGRAIVHAATGNLKKVALELGCKSPITVFPDVDLDDVIPAVAMACILASWQACMAGTRLFVHSDIHDTVARGIQKFYLDAQNWRSA
jgi:phenylacetaldehyde dehydrogenase